MKKLLWIFLPLFLFSGCRNSGNAMEEALRLRQNMLDSDGCSFDATVTADYGEEIYEFTLSCQVDENGDLFFCVTKPESISGIAGKITGSGGQLTFDQEVLAFDLMADGQVTPVSAPWLLIRTFRGGYISSCAKLEDGLQLSIDDSYEEDALHLEIYLSETDQLTGAEIFWKGRRFLTVQVENFQYL